MNGKSLHGFLVCCFVMMIFPLKFIASAQSESKDTSEQQTSSTPAVVVPPRAEGYRGIWYMNQPSKDEYRYKYSGGLGTYCAKHHPMAQYAPEADKTFFVYGGTKGVGTSESLLIMISYFDHKTGLVPKPAILMEKGTEDAHHNPTLTIDKSGHIWVFVSSHGKESGFIWKSTDPYSIDSFEQIAQKEFTYPQPWYYDGFGFMFLFTKYTAGRELYMNTSPDGRTWGEDKKCVGFGGHYQLSWGYKNKRGTAFNWHPSQGGVNARTNLYYMETEDYGETWVTAAGKPLTLPLDNPENDALVRNYYEENQLVYLKDLNFDDEGRPVVLVVLSKGYESGPKNDPRIWTVAHWTGSEWRFHPVTTSDHNYDMGSLYIEEDGTWRIIAPTAPGPQAYCTGGEVAMWTSTDQGETWKKTRQLTNNSPRNHTYVRRPRAAHPDFYAFWADGNALEPSVSRIYFTDKEGKRVRVLPETMTQDYEAPCLLEDSASSR
ncbi:MAG: BNR-4 repeat-containing protein [bacterium]